MRVRWCVALLGAFGTASVVADPDTTINTDRPAVTESSVVVPAGALQVESGLLLSDARGADVLDLPEAYLRYGLLERTELRLTVPDYYRDLRDAATGAAGFGDFALGLKQQLGPIGGLDLSVIAFVSLPTGARPVSSGGYDPGVQLPWSRSLTGGWTVAGQLAAYAPTVAGARNYTGELTLLLDRQLSAPWDAFIEYAGDFRERGGSQQLLHVGTAYKIAAHQQVDLHAALGLSDAAPRAFIGVGYSWLLPEH
ncbi:MAG TPA: transporter [Steroidobacteraceae bacterium]|nr:transporter [Steroidobacteraceae bacterium]